MPILLAGHTYSFRSLPLDQALERLSELGFERVELWTGHVDGDPAAALSALESRGLEAVAVGGRGFYAPGDDPEPVVRLAHEVRAPAIVACAARAELRRVTDSIGERATLCVENHWYQELASSREVGAALAGAPAARACLDTGHALLAGERPERFARRLGPQLRHVHLKESRRATAAERILGRRVRRRLLARPQPVRPGEGELRVELLRETLEALPFDGAVTVEHEGPEPEAAVAELRRRWLAAG